MPHAAPISKKLRLIPLAAVIFFTVSGGPYGLEPLLGYAGKNGALLLLLATPILWDIPTILTVLELNSMMPVTGGYYQWVKRGLGLRMALYEGWLTWLYTFVDLAIYPVLFITYAAYFFPQVAVYKIPVCLVIIWLSALLNILGIVPVGRIAVLLSALVFTPFVCLCVMGFMHHSGPYVIPSPSLKGLGISSIGMGLYTVMWNFLGWDNATTYAGEVKNPIKSYLISTGLAFIAIIGIYFFSILTAVQSGISLNTVSNNGFPALGLYIGGKWLGSALAFGGMACMLGLYSAVLLSVSRIPKVMADDGLMPKKLEALHPRFNSPYISIIVCSVVVSLMIVLSFKELLIMDVTLYGAGLLLEFISLIALRIKAPNQARPFKIPLNVLGLCLMFLFPIGVFGLAVAGAITESEGTLIPLLIALGIMVSAEVIWQYLIWRKPELKKAARYDV
ncbi:amino acid/polyamine/organocation transporter (APC superfamily) [Mucilaginibacter gracilis]|uniref:Amino acid/polyamine/organocation transporter (APC superfamily) n=1 Tax=Mucilaginibacter gracilis TaxID=423350 RepID=A0A495JAK2_9SPHI|nr:APC family permease [Mucilaginibacter gracilis]RKR85089.1 amino acid/polyamine/organocation transporter (APC superfamily) [Mucilaginibacter gracilis]